MPEGINAVWDWLISLAPAPVWTTLGGVILGAAAMYWARQIEERRQRRREMRDLLRLLRSEIKQNEELLRIYTYEPGLVTNRWRRTLSVKTWDKINGRLAQLLKDEDLFADLTEYYEEIWMMHNLIWHSGYSTTAIENIAKQKLPELKESSNYVVAQLEQDRRGFWRLLGR